MKKRAIYFTMALVLVMAFLPAGAGFATDPITVTISGEDVAFPDGQGPVIVEGRTLVPVRGVFETMGFEVGWDNEARTATLKNEGYTVIIVAGSNVFTTNGVEYSLDVPAQVIGGRTMLPIRLVLESVGYELGWDGATRTVVITSPEEENTGSAKPEPSAPPIVAIRAMSSEISAVLGMDFDVIEKVHTFEVDGQVVIIWAFLDLRGQKLNLDDFDQNYMGDIFGSQTGEVFVMEFEGSMTLIIDLGEVDYQGQLIRSYYSIELG